jgi:hypothetical protein
MRRYLYTCRFPVEWLMAMLGNPIGHVGDGYGIFIDWLGAKKTLETD